MGLVGKLEMQNSELGVDEGSGGVSLAALCAPRENQDEETRHVGPLFHPSSHLGIPTRHVRRSSCKKDVALEEWGNQDSMSRESKEGQRESVPVTWAKGKSHT